MTRLNSETSCPSDSDGIGFFERFLTVLVGLCIVVGIAPAELTPGIAKTLDGMAIYVDEAPVVSLPITLCLFFMAYPIMVKIDSGEVLKAGSRTNRLRHEKKHNATRPMDGKRMSLWATG